MQAYLFNDYWEDIGTMKSFFEANLNLAKDPPNFDFTTPTLRFTRRRDFYPGQVGAVSHQGFHHLPRR